jgi:hypothetical protein
MIVTSAESMTDLSKPSTRCDMEVPRDLFLCGYKRLQSGGGAMREISRLRFDAIGGYARGQRADVIGEEVAFFED